MKNYDQVARRPGLERGTLTELVDRAEDVPDHRVIFRTVSLRLPTVP